VPAELLVWTDVEAEHEADFNRWYDREHMDERVAIPGFLSARRFQRVGAGRKYLALYRTESLDVFDSDPYRRAFENQTQWSLLNFKRMRNTVRAVGTIAEAGAGTGGFVGVLTFAAERSDAAGAFLNKAVKQDGVIAGHILTPDPRLSKPLPGAAAGALAGSILLVEATTESAAASSVQGAVGALSADPAQTAIFRLMWELSAQGRV
jgi:hypothetical protein